MQERFRPSEITSAFSGKLIYNTCCVVLCCVVLYCGEFSFITLMHAYKRNIGNQVSGGGGGRGRGVGGLNAPNLTSAAQ